MSTTKEGGHNDNTLSQEESPRVNDGCDTLNRLLSGLTYSDSSTFNRCNILNSGFAR